MTTQSPKRDVTLFDEATGKIMTPGGSVVTTGIQDMVGYLTSVVGDSRTRDMYVTGARKQARSWIVWANAYMNQVMDFVGNYATSGYRSDQFLAESNFANLMNDGSNLVIIGYPAVNDISQAAAGYVDVDGNAVTLTNVISLVLARMYDRVSRLVKAGKVVVVCTEPGATTMNAAQVAVTMNFNASLITMFQGMTGVKVFNPLTAIWARSTTVSAVAFNSGFSADGTHATARQGQVAGYYAATKFFSTFMVPRKRTGVDLRTSSAQLFPNAGYATLTGGTTSNMTGTDAIPGNVVIYASAASLASYTLTSAAADDGTGNEMNLTVTATGAVKVNFRHTGVPTTGLGYTDYFVAGADINVISASACRVYWETQIFTNQGTEDGYDLYAGDAADVWLVNGVTNPVRMQSDPTQPPAGSSTGLSIEARMVLDFKGAGSVNVKIKDPSVYRK